jgi:DNA replication ATP-dependent helicase Dna2
MKDTTANELFDNVIDILKGSDAAKTNINKMMHETLVTACHEGIRDTNQAFGNLFSQVDYLCKEHHIHVPDIIAIQKMRRDSNHSAPLLPEDVLYDARALAIFISAVLQVDIPSELTALIPHGNQPHTNSSKPDYTYIRCIVKEWGDNIIKVSSERNPEKQDIKVNYCSDDLRYIGDLLRTDMQLNLIDCHKEDDGSLTPRMIIVEPDFIIDISTIARCFTNYGHHPLSYTVNRMTPSANSQAILTGYFASSALDDIIHSGADYKWTETLKSNFKEKALEYCTCKDLRNYNEFKTQAVNQVNNLQGIVEELFSTYDRNKAILEPSFVCERLGIQGRVDLMTTDLKLLVEQKSGKNFNIEINRPNEYGSFQKEDHYVQLLLYYGVLRQNFNLSTDKVAIKLLYSKYPLPGGIVSVAFLHQLFAEAIAFRNRIVANEYSMALNGFDGTIDLLSADTLNTRNDHGVLFEKYQRRHIEEVTSPLHQLSPTERSYFSRMMTFVYREQLSGKVGAQEGIGNCAADLWNMPLSEKKETGNIYTDLRIIAKDKSCDYNGFDTITLEVPDQGDEFLSNFRPGDMIYMYSYIEGKEPDVQNSILFKGVLQELGTDRLTVHLNDGLQNTDILDDKESLSTLRKGKRKVFAIEHSASDAGSNSEIRGLHEFITSTEERKQLLLGLREPRQNAAITLSQSYNPGYDEVLLKAKQATDYFLLIGPPGTGKTSMALQFMVKEELNSPQSNLLLMSYTNRAVDEICAMLADNDINFIRMGNEYTCDARFRKYLLKQSIDECPQLRAISDKIKGTRVIVGTTSTMQARPYIFSLKHFSLAIIDEASQILEPDIVGLLASHQKSASGISTILNIDKFILIGDHKQLPAVVQQNEHDSVVDDKLLNKLGINNCRDSLFERLMRQERHAHRTSFIGLLRKQGRMHPDIAEFPNRMFYFNEQLQPVPCPHQTENEIGYMQSYAQDELDRALIGHRMMFIPSEFCKQPNLSEKVNAYEAKVVARILSRIYHLCDGHFDPIKTVGVIVPYRNQIAMIRREIDSIGIDALKRISIDTVERYQGSQRDVIIYSFTVQNSYQLDFLTNNCFVEDGHIIDRKLNVAITRARKQLIITGNPVILSSNNIFKELMQFVKEKDGYFEMKDDNEIVVLK